MANRIFSTGRLFVTLPVVAAIVAPAVLSNAASAGATTTSNFTDPDLAQDPTQYDGLTPATGPATLVIWDLGASYTLSGVTAWYSGTGYQFDCSEDGATWGSELAVSSTFSPSGTEQALTPTGRYVRFRGANLTETKVFVAGAAVGGTPTPIELVTLQNIGIEVAAQKKELYGPVQYSRFPVALAYYGIHFNMKATSAAISAAALKACTGMVNAAGTGLAAGNTVGTLGGNVVVPSMSGMFETTDVSGISVSLVCTNISTPGNTLPFKMDDFVMPGFQFSAYVDPTTGLVGVFTIGS